MTDPRGPALIRYTRAALGTKFLLFRARDSRKEFFYAFIGVIIVGIAFMSLAFFVGLISNFLFSPGLAIVVFLILCGGLTVWLGCVGIGMFVRRLHDCGIRSKYGIRILALALVMALAAFAPTPRNSIRIFALVVGALYVKGVMMGERDHYGLLESLAAPYVEGIMIDHISTNIFTTLMNAWPVATLIFFLLSAASSFVGVVLVCLPGQKGPNAWGPNPLGQDKTEAPPVFVTLPQNPSLAAGTAQEGKLSMNADPQNSGLDAQLEESKRAASERSARRWRAGLIALVALVVAPLAIFGAYHGFYAIRGFLPAVPTSPVSPERPDGIVPADESLPEPEPRPRSESASAPESAPMPQGAPALEDHPLPANESMPSVAPALSRFEEALAELDTMLEAGLAGFHPDEAESIFERASLRRAKAVEAAAEGDFDSGLRLVQETQREVKNTLDGMHERFQLNMRLAAESYEEGVPERATVHIEEAMALRPTDSAAQELAAAIAKLPELLAARASVEEAKKAGNLTAERDALRRLLELDPDDADASKRAGMIETRLREQTFGRAIGASARALEARDLPAAKNELEKAAKIHPAHDQVIDLRERISRLDLEITRDSHIEAAEKAVTGDEWAGARDAYKAALSTDPDHINAAKGLDIADRILTAQTKVDEFLARPNRLGTPSIGAAAEALIGEAEAIAVLSPRLAAGLESLRDAIETMRTPVQVRVLSDNQTDIGIRGMGTIGRTEEHIIELRPNTYVFRGRREGYRDKLVEVVISGGEGGPVEVTVICDESI